MRYIFTYILKPTEFKEIFFHFALMDFFQEFDLRRILNGLRISV